jgi:methylated-DNA-[protein]-cysteine S-methyltransferase
METESLYPLGGCRTTKIYCRPGCPAGKHMKPENRVRFHSREEAIAQGYRACKTCKPDDILPEPETLYKSEYQSPIGTYTIIASNKGIVSLASPVTTGNRMERLGRQEVKYAPGNHFNDELARELDLYFNGMLINFAVPLDMRGTPFQINDWKALCAIPYGETRSYADIAKAIGNPAAVRAVGMANSRNPIAIVVPCHRVIGSDGSLTGYASGLDRKRFLLNLEARVAAHP